MNPILLEKEFTRNGTAIGSRDSNHFSISVWSDNDPIDPGEVADRILRWLRVLLGKDQVVELRALKVVDYHNRNVSGFFDFDHLDDMAQAAAELTGSAEGVYFTLNPLKKDLLARQPNDIGAAQPGNTTTDNDVLRRRWLLIDADPMRPADHSATDQEKATARKLIEKVRNHLTDLGWPEPVLTDSGNGYHLLYRIDLPSNDDGLVKRVLTALANRFDTAQVKIDQKVFNPARIVKLYGTKARKGANTEERPHRWSELVEVPNELNVVPKDLLEAIAAEAPEQKHVLRTVRPGSMHRFSLEQIKQRARKYISEIAPAISGRGGSNPTFHVACILVLGFDLSVEEALPIIKEWNETCQPPWTEKELLHKLRDADKKDEPRGYLLGSRQTQSESLVDGDASLPVKQDDDPNRLAELFLQGQCINDGGPTLRYWQGDWYRWTESKYRKLNGEELRGKLWKSISGEFDALSMNNQGKAKKVSNDLVNNVRSALASMTMVCGSMEQPCWLEAGPKHAANEMLAAKNGLIHLPSLIDGKADLISPTPAFFNSMALGYDIDVDAPVPAKWLAFLNGLWPDDSQSLQTLQEWFGYCLLPDTSQQKLLFLLGPPRSGKGTIARVLRALIGEDNVAGPTLSSLTATFGLAPLIGKQLAIVSDARLSGRSNQAVIVERLLAITGEDALTIDRKNREAVTVKLPTRFMLISNELPKLNDASGAIVSRMILLQLHKSWLDNEDTNLLASLLPELPGILLWAIEGLKRLRQRGRFIQPAQGKAMLDQLGELGSPIRAFVNQCCNLDPTKRELKHSFYSSWKSWCESNGHLAGSEANLTRNLRAAFPQIGETRP